MGIYEFIKGKIESTEDGMEKRVWESLYRDALDYESDVRSQIRQAEELKRALDFDIENIGKGFVGTFTGVSNRADNLLDLVKRIEKTTDSIRKNLHFLGIAFEERDEFWSMIQAELQVG